ncbi:MAG TPA: hypothetical protein DCE80_06285 [Ignavibacteriales bacterium]|nr:hypothetical protein [Ignavibacteriales bacterium]
MRVDGTGSDTKIDILRGRIEGRFPYFQSPQIQKNKLTRWFMNYRRKSEQAFFFCLAKGKSHRHIIRKGQRPIRLRLWRGRDEVD